MFNRERPSDCDGAKPAQAGRVTPLPSSGQRRRNRQLPANATPGQVSIALKGTAFAGPLPPPEQLAEYERILPGAAATLFSAFQSQTEHRQHMERIVVWSDVVRAQIGQLSGLGIAAYVIWTGGHLLEAGQSIAGFSAIGTAVAIAVGPFLVRGYLQSRERQLQQQALPPKRHQG